MNYPDFQQQLSRLHVDTGVPEVHGQLCGLLCTCKAEKAKVHWFSTVLENLKSRPGLLTENAVESRVALQELDEVFTATREQLNSEDFGFELFLDPSPQSAVDRMMDLAAWCNGFVYGFGIGSGSSSGASTGKKNAALPEDTAELVADFQTIAAYEVGDEEADEQLSADTNDTSDEENVNQNDSDITEIEEFIRVGVLLIAEEMEVALHTADPEKAATPGAMDTNPELDRESEFNSNFSDDGTSPTLH